MSERPVVVVTVSYRSSDAVATWLASLESATVRPTVTVVVDNGGETDAHLAVLGDRPGVRLLPRPDNPGYGTGMNAGVREGLTDTDADWLVLANPDLLFDESAIDRMIEVAESDPRIGMVGPLILSPDGQVYPSARRLPSLRTGVGHALFSNIWKSNPWTHAYLADRELPPRQRDAGWLSGSCLLVRREAFESVHGFDESYFMYFEDVDLGARMHKNGWRLVYAPDATVTHEGGRSTRTASRAMIVAHHRSAYLYLARRYHQWYLWPLRAALRVSLGVRSRFAKA